MDAAALALATFGFTFSVLARDETMVSTTTVVLNRELSMRKLMVSVSVFAGVCSLSAAALADHSGYVCTAEHSVVPMAGERAYLTLYTESGARERVPVLSSTCSLGEQVCA